ncbi:hypothetical protein STRAU_6632 [Streptomyces aurantiacus JA 4570]|uniref:RNA polymerase sigma-70 region 2 domain-containing protein n=1 Tax=Streptomyces aurantiacus JA 4570 TaxID=1286094 RepID=S3ZCL1_9ACTN|nr:CU044_5270 family protein [Streptomyces aurantiacus]EPH40369.1 hypothetical protein STRAU_6632 [Streptomyces aurantiacus JA 4570]
MTTDLDDEELLSRTARDTAAFEPLVVRHSAALHGYFARRAPGAADDLLAELWLQAYTARRGFDPARGPVRAWLFGVARNVLSAHWRRTARQRPGLPGDGGDDPWEAVDARLDAAAVAPRLRALLAELPHDERELLLLVAWGTADAHRGRRGGRHPRGDGPLPAAPRPHPAALQRTPRPGRRPVMNMNGRTDERDDLLDFPGVGELITAGDVPLPAPEAVAAAKAAVARAAERETAVVAPLRVRAPRRRRRFLVAAAAVAAIAVGAVAYPVVDVGGEQAATASAAEFLNDMAAVAEGAPAADAKYWKVRVETVNQDDGEKRTTTYFDRAGRVWTVDEDGTVHEPPAGEEGKVKKWPVGERWLTWPELDKLPTDAKALAERFPKDAHSRFRQLVIMLEDAPASPELRSALFEVLADTPGIKLVGKVEDSKGRPGVAVEITQKDWFTTGPGEDVTLWSKDRYSLDPKTGLVLESTHKIRGQDLPADRYTWQEVGPADKIG